MWNGEGPWPEVKTPVKKRNANVFHPIHVLININDLKDVSLVNCDVPMFELISGIKNVGVLRNKAIHMPYIINISRKHSMFPNLGSTKPYNV